MYRLTRAAAQRPTPAELLQHPWIVTVMQQQVSMAFWLRKVWGWEKERRDNAYVLTTSPFTLTPSYLSIPPFLLSFTHFSFTFFVSSTFNSPTITPPHSHAPSIRAASIHDSKATVTRGRFSRLLSRFTCSHNLSEIHDIDTDSLILFPAHRAPPQAAGTRPPRLRAL